MSLTFKAMINNITNRFYVQIQQGYSDIDLTGKVLYDNVENFEKPDNALWVRFSITPINTEQTSLGTNKRFRTVGVAVAQIFNPLGTGYDDAMDLSDAIKTAFRSLNADSIVYRTPYIENVGRTEGGHYQINVTIPFYADDVED